MSPRAQRRSEVRFKAASTDTISAAHLNVVYQPILELKGRQVFAHEALARCTRRGFDQPGALFAQAVVEGQIGRLGRAVREIAVRECSGRLCINVHPQEIESQWLLRVDDPLVGFDHDVYLELDETAALEQYQLCLEGLREVADRTLGHLVIEHFGLDLSNFERVASMQPDIVKLDPSLTRNLHNTALRRQAIWSLCNSFHELGTRVAVVGIEQYDELSAAADCGVDLAQGYLLDRQASA